MNRENIIKTVEVIRGHEHQFDMSHYILKDEGGCNTAGCIAGWAASIDGKGPLEGATVVIRASAFLGITRDQTYTLFTPDLYMSEITAEQACRTLMHLADTGRVDWRAANPELNDE